MKRNFFQFVAVAGVLMAGSLSASAAERLRVNVPFSFVMAGLEFQPGQYTVDESNTGVLTVQGEGHGAAVLTIPAELSKASARLRCALSPMVRNTIWWVCRWKKEAVR